MKPSFPKPAAAVDPTGGRTGRSAIDRILPPGTDLQTILQSRLESIDNCQGWFLQTILQSRLVSIDNTTVKVGFYRQYDSQGWLLQTILQSRLVSTDNSSFYSQGWFL